MLIFEVHVRNEGVDAGRLLCSWEEEPWLAGIRSELRELQHRTLPKIKAARPDFPMPSDDEIERGLDKDIERVREIAAELGPVIFGMAQATLQREVMVRFSQETGLFRSQDKGLVRDLRQETSSLAQKLYNESIGIQRGREAGKKDTKPRKRRATTADRRSKILTAMRGIGHRATDSEDVAKAIGISTKTLERWLEAIEKETGEDFDALIVEAGSKSGQQK